jgi:hypothetical protein
MLNGRVDAAPIELKAGLPTRLRLINIHSDFSLDLTLLDGEATTQWRVLAKDGADLAANQTTPQPAMLRMTVCQTYDVEVSAATGRTMRLKYQKNGFPDKAAPPQYLAIEVK